MHNSFFGQYGFTWFALNGGGALASDYDPALRCKTTTRWDAAEASSGRPAFWFVDFPVSTATGVFSAIANSTTEVVNATVPGDADTSPYLQIEARGLQPSTWFKFKVRNGLGEAGIASTPAV